MKTPKDIKITVLPPSIEEEEVYIQPKEKGSNEILGDFIDECRMDGFSIFVEESGVGDEEDR